MNKPGVYQAGLFIRKNDISSDEPVIFVTICLYN